MFERYGPNSLQVTAYINALAELKPDQFVRIGTGDLQVFMSVMNSALVKATGREAAWVASALDCLNATQHHADPAQKLIAALIGSIFVVLDRLSHSDKRLIYNSISGVIDYPLLFKDYRPEDWAIEYFCEELSEYDASEVYVVDRPDARGNAGDALCDAVNTRAGEFYVLEHTALNAYINQKKHDALYKRFIKPLQIEEAVKQQYPKHMVNIYLPLAAFDSKYDPKIFESLKAHVLAAVAHTPESVNATKQYQYNFPKVAFPVWISRVRWGPVCAVIPIMPVTQSDVPTNIRDDLTRAINDKRNKLKVASASGNKTIMLLDAGDELYVNMFTIFEEFEKLAPEIDWEGIDQVYLLYGRGTATWAVPLKIGDYIYPNLKEHDHYVHWKIR